MIIRRLNIDLIVGGILINKMFEFKKDWYYLVIGMKLELSNIEIFKVY